MKNFVSKLFLSGAILLSLCSCGLFSKVKKPTAVEQGPRIQGIIFLATQAQLDSMCVADTLSLDLSDWLNAVYVDYETDSQIVEYLWIKGTEARETTYVVTPKDSLYRISRRILAIE